MHRRYLLVVVVGAALAFAATASATPSGTNGAAKKMAIPNAPAFDPFTLIVPADENWPVVGGNYYQQRYSSLNQINSGNVTSLKEAWHIHLNSAKGTQYRGEGVPLVYNGVMYMVTGNDDVFAIDATNGTILWKFSSALPTNLTNICCGWDARGLAIGEGKVYLAQLDGRLLALSQQDGGVVWAATNGRFQEGYTMTMAPLYYKGLVIVGVSGSEQGARGSVTAYSAQDGHRVWRFYNVPTPGDIGSGTWPNNSEWQVGGATVWNTPSVDPKTNILTFTTANPDPWSGRGPGDNLFAVSMVGINAITGDYAWHFQIAHHELWDWDCPSPTVMFDHVVNGVLRNIVAEPCKTGWLYEVDRNNGAATVTQIDEKPVPQNAFNNTSPTQPIPVGDAFAEQCPKQADFPAMAPDGQPFIFGCIFTPYDDKQFLATAPGTNGGTVQAASSYNPTTGQFYLFSVNGRQSEKAIPNASSLYRNGRSFTGRQGGGTAASFVTTGDLVSYNPANNRIVWKQHFVPTIFTNATPSGQPGVMSTAGNLLFHGLPEGLDWAFAAYNATTGQELWRSKTDAGIEASSPMTYAVNGVQYVAIYAGGRNTTAAPFTHGDSLYVYKLG